MTLEGTKYCFLVPVQNRFVTEHSNFNLLVQCLYMGLQVMYK
jgi:hypothetical protein